MTARTNYVPLHSIIVTRDDKQVDALKEYERTGKAFKFEQHELDEIAALNSGSLDMSLRAPNEEAPDEERAPPPATSNAPAPAKKVKDADL